MADNYAQANGRRGISGDIDLDKDLGQIAIVPTNPHRVLSILFSGSIGELILKYADRDETLPFDLDSLCPFMRSLVSSLDLNYRISERMHSRVGEMYIGTLYGADAYIEMPVGKHSNDIRPSAFLPRDSFFVTYATYPQSSPEKRVYADD